MMIPTSDANFARDTDNYAVINTNTSAYLLYKQQRNASIAADVLQREVGELKAEFGEIKQLLKQLLQQNVNINR
jgi:hypothetical protein